MAAYQAVRHTMGKMRIPIDFGTTFTKGSGNLPKQLDAIFCKKLALESIAVETKKANEKYTNERFETIFNEFYTAFTSPNFYEKMDYLIWYQGKDFAKRITQELPQFQIEKYYEFAKKQFDYTQFPDLVEFRELIISLSNQ